MSLIRLHLILFCPVGCTVRRFCDDDSVDWLAETFSLLVPSVMNLSDFFVSDHWIQKSISFEKTFFLKNHVASDEGSFWVVHSITT